MTSTVVRICQATALALGLILAPAWAADEAKPTTLRLVPKKQAGIDQGKAVVVKGEAGKTPQRFLLDGVTYLMPVAVALRPVNAGDEVSMSLTKYAWNQPLREGSTDGDILRYQFRTEGEFQVSVTADQADTPYRLMVWVGDETRPELSAVVVKASEFEEADAARWPWVLAGLVLAGVIVVVMLKVVMLKRRKAA